MIRKQIKNQWNGGIGAHTAPKNSECKSPLETFSPKFFGIKTASFSFSIFQRTKLSHAEYYSSLLVQLKDILKEKRRGNDTKGFLSLHNNAPALRELAPQKKLAYLGYQVGFF